MGIHKRENFTETQNMISKYARILSSPARVAILELLLYKDSCICGDIVDELSLSQSTVSQHLQQLKLAGLIRGTIEGPKICYCIDKEGWMRMKNSFDLILNQKFLRNITKLKKKEC